MRRTVVLVLVVIGLLGGCAAPDLSNLSQFIPGATRSVGQ
jgi:hypothetical protein